MQLSYFKTEAEQLAENFTKAALNEVIKEYTLEYESRLKEELRRLKPSFWSGIWASVIGSFIFAM